jgi:hypothetical protein
LTDIREIVIDDGEEGYLDPRLTLWEEVPPPEPVNTGPSFQQINQNPGSFGPIYVRWQVANAQLTEGTYNALLSTRIFNVQLVGTGPQGVYVRTYPTDLYVNVRVTGGTATAGTDFHMASAVEPIDDYDVLTLRIPQGATSAALVVWAKTDASVEGSETVELTLEGFGPPSYTITGALTWVAPDPTIAGPAVLNLTIIDATVPTPPEWSWVGGVALSDLAPPNNRVTILAGSTTGILRFRVLFDPSAGDTDVDIVGAVVSGTCNDPVADTLTVTITDVVVATREVQWAAATLAYAEPDDPANEVTHVIYCTTTQAFQNQTDIPFDLVENNIAAGGGYTLSGGFGVPAGVVRFAPNALQAFLRLRPLANGIQGDGTLTLTLEDGGSLYGLGTNDELLVTILENSGGIIEPTYLAGPRGVRTGRTIIESTMAVVPPSTTLPRHFNATNGGTEECQVVGLARNAAGEWDAVRVLAMTDDDVAGGALGGAQASYPGQTATPIEIQLGAGSTPAESGAYHAQAFDGLTPAIVPCNTSSTEFLRALSDSQASATTAIKPQWVGPTATDPMFPQEGPDLVRVEYYRVILRESGDVTTDGLTAPAANTRCMAFECWIKRRVDVDVVEVEWVLTNTNRDKKQSVLAPDTRSSGTVHLLSAAIKAVPAGWAATWSVANPNESFAGTTITLLPVRASAYEFPPCATMAGRFALYNTVSSSAAEAQRILRYRHLATSTGYYGVTRNNVWGVWGDVLTDPVRAGYGVTWGGVPYTGWLGFEQSGAQYAAAARTGWDTGTGGYPRLDDRYGWFQSVHPRNYQTGGGNAINGQTALIPSCGYWEDAWFAIAASVMRQRVGMKDVVSGDEAWQQSLVDEHDGTYAPLVQAGNDRLGMARLPAFNTDALVDTTAAPGGPGWSPGSANIHGAATSFMCKAPTTRPWNNHEGTRDPDIATISHEWINGYQHTDFSHCARYREQIEDAWWGCWSPLAWWNSMHLGAWVSRGMSAHLVDPDNYGQAQHGSIEYVIWDQHVGNINARAAAEGSPLEKGRPYVGDIGFINGWWPVGNVRMFGHAPTIIAQAYAIGGDRQRAWIVPTSGPNWFEAWAEFVTDFSTPIGVFASEGFANIDPHVESIWGPTNLANRTGATPPSTSTPVPPATRYHAALMFHQNFISAGAWAVYWRAIKNQNSTLQVALRKVLRTGYYVRESARPWTGQQGTAVLGSYAVPARGNFVPASVSGFPTAPDAGTFMADYWHSFAGGSALGADHAGTHAPHYGVCVYAWREARDQGLAEQDEYLTPALAYFQVPGDELAPDWEEVRDIAYARLRAQTNAGNTGNATTLQQNLHGANLTFLAAFINEMVNRTT